MTCCEPIHRCVLCSSLGGEIRYSGRDSIGLLTPDVFLSDLCGNFFVYTLFFRGDGGVKSLTADVLDFHIYLCENFVLYWVMLAQNDDAGAK